MKIIDRIKNREALTPTESQIAEYIRAHTEDVIGMTLDEFAERIYVSKSTIIRFCKKFGFHGHKELCVELAKELNAFSSDEIDIDASRPFAKEDSPEDTARKMISIQYKAINDIYSGLSAEALLQTAKEMQSTRSVTIYALEEHYIAAYDFAVKLRGIGYQVNTCTMPGQYVRIAAAQPENSIALFIAYSSRETSLVSSARILNGRNIPVCLICGPMTGTLKKLADIISEGGFYEPQPRTNIFGTRTAVFLMLDILYAILFNLDYERNQGIIKTVSEIQQADR